MLGPEGVINLISDRLEQALPAKITELRARLSLDGPGIADDNIADLRAPTIMRSEPEDYSITAAAFPAVYIVDKNTDQVAVNERTQFGETYLLPYGIHLVIYVRDNSFTETKAQLRRMTLAVREVVLGRPLLTDEVGQWVRADKLRWTEQYGIPGQANVGIVAGSVLATVWMAQEQLAHPTTPQVTAVSADMSVGVVQQ